MNLGPILEVSSEIPPMSILRGVVVVVVVALTVVRGPAFCSGVSAVEPLVVGPASTAVAVTSAVEPRRCLGPRSVRTPFRNKAIKMRSLCLSRSHTPAQ